jgi:hypothetical protein
LFAGWLWLAADAIRIPRVAHPPAIDEFITGEPLDAGHFHTPMDLFFSRRIAHPQFGAKLTGKVGSLAIGALMMDDRAPGERVASGNPPYEERATNGALRVQHEFGRQI